MVVLFIHNGVIDTLTKMKIHNSAIETEQFVARKENIKLH